MASGLGLHGFEGRCYQFWREFQGCLIDNKGDTSQCGDHVEDYMECLHHKKEGEQASCQIMLQIQRNNAIHLHAQEKERKKEQGHH